MRAIRPARAEDIPDVAALLREYMRELFDAPWSGTQEALARDASAGELELMVAEHDGERVGFAAWRRAYDLHHCVSGGEVIDLYVRPSERGRAVALQLVAAVAAAIHARGGRFVKGQAANDDPARRKLYERIAVAFPGADCIVGGRAFRTLAGLAGRPARELVTGLPDKQSNYEP